MRYEKGQRLCEVEDCNHEYLAKGVCRMHYERLRRNGTVENLSLNRPTIAQTIASKTEWRGDCLIWTGNIGDQGYGIMYRGSKNLRVHRLAWLEAGLPLEPSELLDHFTCYNRACVNIAHLRVATHKKNNENRKGANKNSTTGVRGVSWDKSKKFYKAQVMHNRVQYFKGGFSTIEEAEKAVIEMRLEFYGEVVK